MNLGVIEAQLLPALRRTLGEKAAVHAGPPTFSAATGIRLDVWLHAAHFEDLGGVTHEGARIARRPVRLRSNLRGFAEERPARITIEATCTGPNVAAVQAVCGELPPPLLLALETMPAPELSASPNQGVVLRFADFAAAVAEVRTGRGGAGDAAFHVGVVRLRLDGFLHVTVAQRGGVERRLPGPPPALTLRVVQGPVGRDASGEHVVIANEGAEPIRLDRYVLQDAALQRPHRFVLPAMEIAPGASLRIWTGRGSPDEGNLYWGRAKSVWNNAIDRAMLVDPSGTVVARAAYPRRRGAGR